jgi:hypothetical protein
LALTAARTTSGEPRRPAEQLAPHWHHGAPLAPYGPGGPPPITASACRNRPSSGPRHAAPDQQPLQADRFGMRIRKRVPPVKAVRVDGSTHLVDCGGGTSRPDRRRGHSLCSIRALFIGLSTTPKPSRSKTTPTGCAIRTRRPGPPPARRNRLLTAPAMVASCALAANVDLSRANDIYPPDPGQAG